MGSKSQSDKFRETAREIEADESTERFERALEKLVKSDTTDKKTPANVKPKE